MTSDRLRRAAGQGALTSEADDAFILDNDQDHALCIDFDQSSKPSATERS